MASRAGTSNGQSRERAPPRSVGWFDEAAMATRRAVGTKLLAGSLISEVWQQRMAPWHRQGRAGCGDLGLSDQTWDERGSFPSSSIWQYPPAPLQVPNANTCLAGDPRAGRAALVALPCTAADLPLAAPAAAIMCIVSVDTVDLPLAGLPGAVRAAQALP